MTVSAGDIVRIAARVNIVIAGEQVNVLHARLTSGPAITDATASSQLATLTSTLYGLLNTMIQTAVVPNVIDMQVVSPVPLTLPSAAWTAAFVPAGGGQPLPNQATALVLGQTTTPRVQGRKNIFTMSELNQSGGLLDAPAIAALVAFGASWIVPQLIGGSTWDYGVWNQVLTRFLTFSTAAVIDTLRTQRRRTPLRGS